MKTKESKMKLSQWHDGSVKPVHVGVYESDNQKGRGFYQTWYRKWDGKRWINGNGSVEWAFKQASPSLYQDWPWRGIVKDKK